MSSPWRIPAMDPMQLASRFWGTVRRTWSASADRAQSRLPPGTSHQLFSSHSRRGLPRLFFADRLRRIKGEYDTLAYGATAVREQEGRHAHPRAAEASS